MSMKEITILDRAKEATVGRMSIYGHPEKHFTIVARLWSAYLGDKTLVKSDVGLMMILFKVAREMLSAGFDTKADIAGYARNLEMLIEAEEERESAK